MMTKRKSALWIICVLTIDLSITVLCVIRGCNTPTSSLVRIIQQSDKVCIFDEEMDEVLYETSEADEIIRLRRSFVPMPSSPKQVLMGWYPDRYFLMFYSDSKLVAKISILENLSFHWRDSDYSWDFLLTSESYCLILPWLCEKSEKGLSEFSRGYPGKKLLK